MSKGVDIDQITSTEVRLTPFATDKNLDTSPGNQMDLVKC